MKKNDTDIRDIYRVQDPTPEPDREWKTSELVEREIRRQRVFNISVGLLTFALTAFLIVTIANDFLFAGSTAVPVKEKTPSVAAYTLPEDEQWALEYRQIASQTENSAPGGPKVFSTKWVKNAAYHIIMGEQALRLNELAIAQDHLEATIDTFPSITGIQQFLGLVYLKRQDFKKAITSLQKALEEQPSIEVLNNLGVAYVGIEDFARAEAVLQQALQQRPELAGGHKNLALLYQKTGRTNEAAASFEKYFTLNPQDTLLLQSYVAYLSAAGRSPAAQNFIEQLQGADPLKRHLLLAKIAAQNQDVDRAVRALQAASHLISPRQAIAEMHDAAFDKIARTKPFEALLYRLELAAVSLSPNLDAKDDPKH